MSKAASRRRAGRSFTDEFKASTVRLVLEEGRTVGAVARELDLTDSTLRLWVEQARAEQTKGKSGLMEEEREELALLRKEVRVVTEERDILKKRWPSSRSRAGEIPVHRDGDVASSRSRSPSRVVWCLRSAD
ncbi:MAG: transposase [Vicinamibacterales bacterium]